MLISTEQQRAETLSDYGFNPSTGLMLISTTRSISGWSPPGKFQSLDWVDVDFDTFALSSGAPAGSFNPSTGLMLISTPMQLWLHGLATRFNPSTGLMLISTCQSSATRRRDSFNPSTGLMLISTKRKRSKIRNGPVSIPRLG